MIKDFGVGGEGPSSEILETSGGAAAVKVLGCRMTGWRRSTREGSIYGTKRAGANLIYLFAASVKSEGVQMDMVTVRTIIKGLHR